MRAQINVLQEVLKEWLQLHELDHDFWLYSQEQWSEREGEDSLLKGAELIFAFDNALVSGVCGEAGDELQELAEGFGYYFELGHHWSLEFYPLEVWPSLPSANATYSELLRDSRWQAKRLTIIERAKGACDECHRADTGLEVHHCYYRFGRMPWQYPNDSLLALCRGCHINRNKAEMKLRGFLPKLQTTELGAIQDFFGDCLYWYNRDDVFRLLHAMARDEVDTVIQLKRLLAARGHPEDRGEERQRFI